MWIPTGGTPVPPLAFLGSVDPTAGLDVCHAHARVARSGCPHIYIDDPVSIRRIFSTDAAQLWTGSARLRQAMQAAAAPRRQPRGCGRISSAAMTTDTRTAAPSSSLANRPLRSAGAPARRTDENLRDGAQVPLAISPPAGPRRTRTATRKSPPAIRPPAGPRRTHTAARRCPCNPQDRPPTEPTRTLAMARSSADLTAAVWGGRQVGCCLCQWHHGARRVAARVAPPPWLCACPSWQVH